MEKELSKKQNRMEIDCQDVCDFKGSVFANLANNSSLHSLTLKALKFATLSTLELPSSLRSLTIFPRYANFPKYELPPLPLEVEELNLKQWIVKQGDFNHLPSRLTHLRMESCRIENVDQVVFPSTLTCFHLRRTLLLPVYRIPLSVTQLTLFRCNIDDIFQCEIPANVKTLNLQANRIQTVTGWILPPNLESLNLRGNLLSSVSELVLPSSLRELDVSDNLLLNDVFQWTLPHRLETVNFSYTSEFQLVSDLTLPLSLKELILEGMAIRTLSGLSFPSSLVRLSLFKNKIHTLVDMSSLVELKVLNLSRNQISTLPPLVFPPNLTTLYLSHNRISDVAQIHCPDTLLELELAKNHITDVSQLVLPLRLQKLNLNYNVITAIAPLKIPHSLLELNVVSFTYSISDWPLFFRNILFNRLHRISAAWSRRSPEFPQLLTQKRSTILLVLVRSCGLIPHIAMHSALKRMPVDLCHMLKSMLM